MSRAVRVVVILALFGWAVAGVPDRVQAQRDAVADLASERGAASAGGELLARIADLRGVADGELPDVWQVEAGDVCAPAAPEGSSYDDVVAAVRRKRACDAARQVTPGRTAAMLVEVDGDPFLVVPGPAGRPGADALRLANLDGEALAELDLAGASAAAAVMVVPAEPVGPAAPVVPEVPEVPEVPGDEDALVAIHALQALQALGLLQDVDIPALLRGKLPSPDPGPSTAAATVAWWPPLQARIEARTGIPLQVGGEPPRARAILPAHRLAGVPVWSLPTPATEATIDLLDGGTFFWLLLLGALLAREAWSFRRADVLEQERQTTRDAILQRISHELRTPAASVRSLVDALALPDVSEAERAQFRELARSEAERLATGIDRLLQAARGETRVSIDPVPLDLAAWADAVRARWATRLPSLVVQAHHPSPAVADPERLDEAVDALLDNAVKYGGPNVTLTVTPDRVVVEDDGEGIPPADQSRVVQKFERREGRVNDPGGHGLGLWAVAEVARAHRGRLTIEGRSRFVLTLGPANGASR
ncbi:MAG: HAMP domain-containing sensor histidine kinase [Pseudomonadota bacterium]|nr:HAMP domain-containing sensor histidine kinase [Pseudomonadota bacterium]